MRFTAGSLSLRAQVAICAALLTLGLTVILTAIAAHTTTRQLQHNIRQTERALADRMADALSHGMFERYRDLQVASSLNLFRDEHQSLADQRAWLDKLKETFPDYAWIGFAGNDGIVRVSTDRLLEGGSVAQRQWFVSGQTQPMISDVHEAADLARLLPNPGGEPIRLIDIATPVKAADGHTVGVLGAYLSWRWVGNLRRSLLRNLDPWEQLDILILDQTGLVLLGPDRLMGEQIKLIENDERKSGRYRITDWPDGHDYVSATSPSGSYLSFAGFNWLVVVRQPAEIAFAPARALRDRFILTGICLAVLFAALGWLAATYLTRPLRAITATADRISQGIRHVTFPIQAGCREVAVLTRSLRDLIAKLLDRERDLISLNTSLEQRVADRTARLAEVNNSLKAEMEHRKFIERERETLIEKLREQASHDPLTGLLNRRAFMAMAERDRRRMLRQHGQLAALMLDIDHFKQINDRYGHAAGDEVIRQVAATVKQAVRDTDLVCRYGGEEIAILLADPGTPRAGAIAERIRVGIAGLRFAVPDYAPGTTFQVTASLGGSIARTDDLDMKTIAALLALADQSLYLVKQGGRNHTIIDRQPVEPLQA